MDYVSIFSLDEHQWVQVEENMKKILAYVTGAMDSQGQADTDNRVGHSGTDAIMVIAGNSSWDKF